MLPNQARLTLLLLLALLATLSFSVSAQVQKDVIELGSNGCEIDELNFSVVGNAAKEALLEQTGFLIAVARMGKGDKSSSLNQQRLSATKEYIVNRMKFPAEKLILAIGEKVKDNGRVEFYINGNLTHIILPKSNIGLCTECCIVPAFDKQGRRIDKPKSLPKLNF